MRVFARSGLPVKLIIHVAQGVRGEDVKDFLGPSAHLGPPPTHAYKQKTPILKELRSLVLKGVTNELQKPAKDEESGGKHPERMIENSGHGKRQREHDQRNAKAMAESIDRMGMAACVLRDPLFAGAST
jgi:hypothetical protein